MNNKTTQKIIEKLNIMQSEHIKVLNDRIDMYLQTIKKDKETIKEQSETINRYIHVLLKSSYNE